MKGNFKHITFEQRKVILSMINSKHKLKEIGEALNLDPTSISKEVKRNRIRLYPIHNPNINLKVWSKHELNKAPPKFTTTEWHEWSYKCIDQR